MPSRILLLSLTFALGALVACTPYRVDIKQGSFLTNELVEQVEVGMTREQVRFLLGTPMINDPFRDDRWDYVYYLESRYLPDRRAYMIVWFDGDAVARVELRDPPQS